MANYDYGSNIDKFLKNLKWFAIGAGVMLVISGTFIGWLAFK